MADNNWGAFVQGLAGTAPQMGMQVYALRQRDEALARQEKQLTEQMKKQEINEAQQSLYKGLEWSEKLSDDVKPQIIDSMIVPAMKTLRKHNVMAYDDEQVQEFATKLKGNVTVGGQFMKDFKNIIDLNTDKKSGSVNYKEILKGVDMLLPTYGKKLTENEMKVAEIQKGNIARQGVTDPNTSPDDKKLLGSYLPANAQKALGIGEEKQAINDFNVFYRGYKEKNPNATEGEISKAWHDMKVKEQTVVANIRIPPFSQASDLPPGYTFNRKTGKYNAPDGKEVTPQEFSDLFTEKAGMTGGKQSIAQQEKVIGMMDGFVRNINKQVDRTDEIAKDLVKRVGVRALDLPIRKLKMGFIGSGEEAILEAYTIEISNEIGKLSTGSAASIRELSVDAQKQWAKIHDPNLSFRELVKVLKETKKMGNMRLQSSQEAIGSTKDRMRGKKAGITNKTPSEMSDDELLGELNK